MSCRLDNIKERQRVISSLSSDFSDPYIYHGCKCEGKDDILKFFSNWDNLFIHVDNIRYIYRNADFIDEGGKTYKKTIPDWFEKKYSKNFTGPSPHETFDLANS